VALRKPGPVAIGRGFEPVAFAEASALGWPCVGAWRLMAARVVAGAPVPIALVPRGTTPAAATASRRETKTSSGK